MEIAEHQQHLLDAIENSLKLNGHAGGLSHELRAAFVACPRHLFARRFRVFPEDTIRDTMTEADLFAHAPLIYGDRVLRYVGANGEDLPSTNSQPSFIAMLLRMLDLRPGHRVLEIGSGGGWFVALAARLVSPGGHVSGVEIIETVAEDSRASLTAAGVENVSIHTGDGALGYAARAPFDRIAFTAATWDLPAAIIDQLRDGGLLLVPLQFKGYGTDVVLLRKTGRHLCAEAALLAYFVHLTGSKGADAGGLLRLEELPFWDDVKGSECGRQPTFFGGSIAENFAFRTSAFCSFLTKIEPRMRGLAGKGGGFAIVDTEARSVAVCEPRQIVGYGGPQALTALLAAYRRWTELFMPAAQPFDLLVYPAAEAPTPPAGSWLELRGDAALLWSLRSARAS